jgi:HlyD family secretion protein
LAVLAWRVLFAGPRIPDTIVTLSGRIEGDDAAIAPKTGGRILEMRVREGDHVNANDVIALTDDEQVRAREQQAQAAVIQFEAQARGARDQIAVLHEQLRQSELQAEQAAIDATGRVQQSQAELAAAEATLAQQQAALQIALFDKEAYTRLAAAGAASARQAKEAVAKADEQGAVVAAAERQVDAARAVLAAVRANLTTPTIRAAQAAAVRRQIVAQEAQVAGATAETERARALLAEAASNRQDLTVRAPFAGTITTRTAEPGEVVTSGTPLVTLLDLGKVYLRGFVPEREIGKVKVGQPARVYLDSDPDRPVAAVVSRVDPRASFTPESTYFRDDRVKQVVGLKLQLKSATGLAKPGMPADGEVLVGGATWPNRRVAP